MKSQWVLCSSVALTAALWMPLVSNARAEDAPASQPATAPAATPSTAPTGDTVEATDQAALKAAAGKTITVHGKVSKTFTPKSGSVLLINFEGANRDFTVVVPKASMETVNGGFNGDVEAAVKDQSINVTGTIKMYKEKPEIEVTKPDQIKLAESK